MQQNCGQTSPEYRIEPPNGNLEDAELVDLLTKAYVHGGFTPASRAATIFEPSAIRERGYLISARANKNNQLAGMVIVVLPDSPARRLAKSNEVELHLLAVAPEHQGRGLGRQLLTAALQTIRTLGFKQTILWTQPKMHAAQRLYESMGFARKADRDPTFDNMQFLAYELQSRH